MSTEPMNDVEDAGNGIVMDGGAVDQIHKSLGKAMCARDRLRKKCTPVKTLHDVEVSHNTAVSLQKQQVETDTRAVVAGQYSVVAADAGTSIVCDGVNKKQARLSRRHGATKQRPCRSSSKRSPKSTVASLLGQGTYGYVHRVEVDGTTMALKYFVYRKNERFLNNLHEADMMLRMRAHPSLVQIHYVSLDRPGDYIDDVVYEEKRLGKLSIIMKCYECDLYTYVQERWRVASLCRIARDLICGLNMIHSMGILHRDIKPTNIFLSSGDRACIGDFGLARVYNGVDVLSSSVSHANYRSPEMIAKIPYDYKMDVWAMGVILYHLFLKRALFKIDTDASIADQLLSQFAVVPDWTVPLFVTSKIKKKITSSILSGKPKRITRGCPAMPQNNRDQLENLLQCLLNFNPSVRLSSRSSHCHELFSLKSMSEYESFHDMISTQSKGCRKVGNRSSCKVVSHNAATDGITAAKCRGKKRSHTNVTGTGEMEKLADAMDVTTDSKRSRISHAKQGFPLQLPPMCKGAAMDTLTNDARRKVSEALWCMEAETDDKFSDSGYKRKGVAHGYDEIARSSSKLTLPNAIPNATYTSATTSQPGSYEFGVEQSNHKQCCSCTDRHVLRDDRILLVQCKERQWALNVVFDYYQYKIKKNPKWLHYSTIFMALDLVDKYLYSCHYCRVNPSMDSFGHHTGDDTFSLRLLTGKRGGDGDKGWDLLSSYGLSTEDRVGIAPLNSGGLGEAGKSSGNCMTINEVYQMAMCCMYIATKYNTGFTEFPSMQAFNFTRIKFDCTKWEHMEREIVIQCMDCHIYSPTLLDVACDWGINLDATDVRKLLTVMQYDSITCGTLKSSLLATYVSKLRDIPIHSFPDY